MRRYLRQVYSISLSSSICPLEYFIASVVGQVPIPVEGGRPFHLILDAALISATSRPMASILFDVPPERFFPIMDLDFAGPLRSFSVDILLTVFALMLREAKIVFVSKSNALLTETMETLRMLLFPLQWASCFVSRLPLTLTGLLQAPGGFMIGIHLDDCLIGKHLSALHSAEASRRFIQSMHIHYPLLQGTYIVDLVSNSINLFNGRYTEQLSPSNVENLLKTLPTGPKLRLRSKLFKIADDFRIGPQLDELEEIDSAFDFQSQSMSDLPPRDWTKFPTLALRDSFMSFIADLLGDYTTFIIPPVDDLNADTYRTFREEFMVDEYLSYVDPQCRSALEFLMETQMFSVLLQTRSEGTSQSLVFFEEAAKLQQTLGLSLNTPSSHASNHSVTSLGGAVHHQMPRGAGHVAHGVCELPYPLYTLLESEHRWSCLNKVMQQQTLQRAQPAGSHSPKPVNLTYMSTNSIAPLRALGSHALHNISYSHHPVQNQQLLDLLQFIEFTHLNDPKDSTAMSPVLYSVARRELDRNEDLQLQVQSLGPLILPGPTLGDTVDAPEIDENTSLFCYNKGWPQLDSSLTDKVDTILHSRIRNLRQERIFTLNKVNPTMKLFLRSPSERLFSDVSALLHSPRANSNHNSSSHNLLLSTTSSAQTPPPHHVSSSVMSGLLTVLSVSITTLALRIMTGMRPLEDMLQILGIVATIESWGLSDQISETTWRTILVACGSCGGDAMRRISALIFKAMQRSGLVPNALTYGQYIRAIGAKKQEAATLKISSWIDPHYYLEEIGFTWYTLKVKDSYASEASMRQRTSSTRTPISTPTIVSTNSSSRSSRRRQQNKAAIIAPLLVDERYVQDLEDPLRLKRAVGTVVTFRPKSLAGVAHPLNTAASSEATSTVAINAPEEPLERKELQQALRYLQKRCDKIHDMAKKLQRRNSKLAARSRQSSFTTTISTSSAGRRGSRDLGLHAVTATPEKISTMLSQMSHEINSRSPMNFMSKVGGSLFGGHSGGAHGGTTSAGQHSKNTSPMPPTNMSVTNKAGAALSSFLSKGTSLFAKSQATTPVPSTTVSPVRPTNADDTRKGLEGNAQYGLAPTNGHEDHHKKLIEQQLLLESRAAQGFEDEEDNSSEGDGSDTASLSKTSPRATHDADHSHVDDENRSNSAGPEQTSTPIPPTGETLLAGGHKSGDSLSSLVEAADIDAEIDEDGEDGQSPLGLRTIDERAGDLEDEESEKMMTLDKVQETVLSTVQVAMVARRSCMGMHCSCECFCGISMMFEEILALWSHGNSIDVHRPATARLSTTKQTVNADQGIQCTHCQKALMPTLKISQYVLQNETNADSSIIVPGWDEEVSMISPFILQFELEELVLKVGGELVNHGPWLHRHHPAVYWNLLWYSSRFQVPSGLQFSTPSEAHAVHLDEKFLSHDYFFRSEVKLTDEAQLDSALVVGWLPSVVTKKAQRLLQGLPGDYLDIRDIFPACTEDDFRVISNEVLSNLDGSPDGLRSAMLHLCSCSCVFDGQMLQKLHDSPSLPIIKARIVYTRLLMLGVHFAHLSVYEKTKFGMLRDYNKVKVDCRLMWLPYLF